MNYFELLYLTGRIFGDGSRSSAAARFSWLALGKTIYSPGTLDKKAR